MSTLYELTGEMLELFNMAEEESDEEIQRVISDTLEGVEGELDIKMESYAKVIKNLEVQAVAIKEEEKRLAGRRKTLEKNMDRMKAAMMSCMKTLGKTRAGGELFTVSIAKNGGKAPLIFQEGLTAYDIPEEYRDWTPEFNKESIRAAIEAGEDLGFARLGDRGESLRIK